MSDFAIRRLAWWLAGAFVAVYVVGLVLTGIAHEQVPFSAATEAPFLVTNLAFVAAGMLIVSAHPRHAVGWLLIASAIGEALWSLSVGYAAVGLQEGLPGTETAAWLAEWISTLGQAFVGLTVLLFPTGRLPTRRWRPVGWALVLAAGANTTLKALQPGPLGVVPRVANPVGVEALDGVSLDPLVFFLLIACVVSLGLRFRRAQSRERQQIKWVLWTVTLLIPFFAILGLALSGPPPEGAIGLIASLVIAALISCLPAAFGVAILRHRLYDVDVAINRTLVYGALTAALVGTYAGTVVLLQLLLNPLTPESDLAIAGSTLAVAALFRPLRSRIQTAVDMRFYRRRYDAARTVQAFSGRLRDEVELEAVEGELRRITAETMQPAHVSVWLREVGTSTSP
jgi:hypothetical protein